MATPTTDVAFVFNPPASTDALPLAAMTETDADQTSMPPLSAEASDEWVAQALFDCYN